MALEVKNVSHAYSAFQAVNDVSFTAEAGKITCLLGASGCGKSTLLRLVAGIMPLQSGQLILDGEVLAQPRFSPPPEMRPVGLVFQEGALFPHMSVEKNIGYGVADKSSRRAIATSLLDRMGLAEFGPRYPHTLSGGQQQRVALARALAPAPRVLLLDEPFANIDIIQRRSLRMEIAQLLAELGCISVMVTHDPEEAIEIADHVVVMAEGRIAGVGTPAELYDAPPNEVVGLLIGGGTVVSARVTSEQVQTAYGDWPVACLAKGPPVSGEVRLLVRREALVVSISADGLEVLDERRMAGHSLLRVRASSGESLTFFADKTLTIGQGDRVMIEPKPASVFAFPEE